MRGLTRAMCAGAAALISVGTTGAIAFAAGDSVTLPKTGTLVARGVAVNFNVRYTCQASDGTSGVGIVLDLRENSHGYVADGEAQQYGNLTCDGTSHVTKVTVTANPNGPVFVPGTAYINFVSLDVNYAPTASKSGVTTLLK